MVETTFIGLLSSAVHSLPVVLPTGPTAVVALDGGPRRDTGQTIACAAIADALPASSGGRSAAGEGGVVVKLALPSAVVPTGYMLPFTCRRRMRPLTGWYPWTQHTASIYCSDLSAPRLPIRHGGGCAYFLFSAYMKW